MCVCVCFPKATWWVGWVGWNAGVPALGLPIQTGTSKTQHLNQNSPTLQHSNVASTLSVAKLKLAMSADRRETCLFRKVGIMYYESATQDLATT